jgi:hypothetical protein
MSYRHLVVTEVKLLLDLVSEARLGSGVVSSSGVVGVVSSTGGLVASSLGSKARLAGGGVVSLGSGLDVGTVMNAMLVQQTVRLATGAGGSGIEVSALSDDSSALDPLLASTFARAGTARKLLGRVSLGAAALRMTFDEGDGFAADVDPVLAGRTHRLLTVPVSV